MLQETRREEEKMIRMLRRRRQRKVIVGGYGDEHRYVILPVTPGCDTGITTRRSTTMRTITAAFFISLDGVVESPDKWHFPYFNDEMGAAIGAAMTEADGLMMGRVNYQEWATYWPSQSNDDQFARFMNTTRKYVVSQTLDTAEWNNTTVINGDVEAKIAELKQQPGKNIAISGSPTLVRSLLAKNLLDELQLMIHPIVVGSGKRLFTDNGRQTALKLIRSETFSTGVVFATYGPA
jgi:dihydrofolate reductase